MAGNKGEIKVIVPPSSIGKTLKNKENYRILILSDLHIPIDMELKEMVVNSELIKKIDYVILPGDNVACYGNDYEYQMVNKFIEKLNKPYTAVNGNHEFMFKVQKYNSENYGKIWERTDKEERKKQIEKFYNFFHIKTPFWSEKLDDILYIFFTIGDFKKEKIEVLPEKSEEFLVEKMKKYKNNIEKTFIFCHAPLKGSAINGFKYYDENGDPFVYLKDKTLNFIDEMEIPVYWFSGHIPLHPSHPMAIIRKVRKYIFQVNCPPSWKFSRKSLEDIVPKRYDDFYSLIIEINRSENKLLLFNWKKKKSVKEFLI